MPSASPSRSLLAALAGVGALTLALLLVGSAASTGTELEPEGIIGPATDQVILLHGLARNPRAMRPLEKRLEEEGFRVQNLGYPSRQGTPQQLVDHLDESVSRCCADPGAPLHFVTHSLGGILVRAYLAEHRPVELGRVVMLAPPNKGTELVDEFGDDWWFEPMLGPTARQLGTGPGSFPNRIPAPDYELGVIAATHPLASRLGRWLMHGRNDGVVSVENARLEGMRDFLLVETGHVRIRADDQVADETVHFLRHGHFATGEKRIAVDHADGRPELASDHNDADGGPDEASERSEADGRPELASDRNDADGRPSDAAAPDETGNAHAEVFSEGH